MIGGTNFGTATINTMTLNGSGTALNLIGGTLTATIDSLTSTFSTNAVILSGVNGTLSITTGAISGATSGSFRVEGGAATVTYGGTITGTAGRMISVSDTTGGSVSFTTATANGLTDSGTGILIDGAAGNVTINNADLNGSRGIEILGDATNNATGTFTFNNVTIDTTAVSTNFGLFVNGDVSDVTGNDVSATIDLNNVDITNPGGHVAIIMGLSGGSVDFDAASTINRSNGGFGILVNSNAGGTVTFNSTTKTLNTDESGGEPTNNPGTANFAGGNLTSTRPAERASPRSEAHGTVQARATRLLRHGRAQHRHTTIGR